MELAINKKLADFLKYTDSQKEVSLIISKDSSEFHNQILTLIQSGFKRVENIQELLAEVSHQSKICFVSIEPLSSEIFKIICQYSQGKISHTNSYTNSQITVSPVYQNSAFILVMSEVALAETIRSGKNILNKVGITFRQE